MVKKHGLEGARVKVPLTPIHTPQTASPREDILLVSSTDSRVQRGPAGWPSISVCVVTLKPAHLCRTESIRIHPVWAAWRPQCKPSYKSEESTPCPANPSRNGRALSSTWAGSCELQVYLRHFYQHGVSEASGAAGLQGPLVILHSF